MGLTLSYDGKVYSEVMDSTEDQETRWGMQAVGPQGLSGAPAFPPPSGYKRPTATVRAGSRDREMAIIPFTPNYQWAFTPGAALIAGVGNEYRFEIHRSDGSVMIIKKLGNAYRCSVRKRPFTPSWPDSR